MSATRLVRKLTQTKLLPIIPIYRPRIVQPFLGTRYRSSSRQRPTTSPNNVHFYNGSLSLEILRYMTIAGVVASVSAAGYAFYRYTVFKQAVIDAVKKGAETVRQFGGKASTQATDMVQSVGRTFNGAKNSETVASAGDWVKDSYNKANISEKATSAGGWVKGAFNEAKNSEVVQSSTTRVKDTFNGAKNSEVAQSAATQVKDAFTKWTK